MNRAAAMRSPLRIAALLQVAILHVAILAVGCERADVPPSSAAAPPPLPVAVSGSEFQGLRWILGSWRGTGEGVSAFYEGYSVLDDSTVMTYGFKDSTLAVVTDGGLLTLRGGELRSVSLEREYVAVAIDTMSVRFAPLRNATNGFEWRRGGEGEWSARLTWDSAGVARERVYAMRAHRAPRRATARR